MYCDISNVTTFTALHCDCDITMLQYVVLSVLRCTVIVSSHCHICWYYDFYIAMCLSLYATVTMMQVVL
uniref:Uncharacterized protein n=1 Tax=Octopus bimaculoides TaxID=37653 RepID=A0A0L8HI85_OCTBM